MPEQVSVDLDALERAAAGVAGTLEVAARRRLRLIGPDEVVDWASTHLTDRAEPEMVELAALSVPADSVDVDGLLVAMTDGGEHGALDETRARVVLAESAARRIVAGSVSPYEGAREIWALTARDQQARSIFGGFIGAASEWEDDPDHRDTHERTILEEARNVLRTELSRPPDPSTT